MEKKCITTRQPEFRSLEIPKSHDILAYKKWVNYKNLRILTLSLSERLATPTRFELAISALTGPYVKPLHHGAAKT